MPAQEVAMNNRRISKEFSIQNLARVDIFVKVERFFIDKIAIIDNSEAVFSFKTEFLAVKMYSLCCG